jgi:hypothetical protein
MFDPLSPLGSDCSLPRTPQLSSPGDSDSETSISDEDILYVRTVASVFTCIEAPSARGLKRHENSNDVFG